MADELKDLAIVPITSSDTNYFLRKVTGLKIDKNYSFKFQWVFEDDSKSEWSPGYQIGTPTETVPSAVTATVPLTAIGNIPVTLSTFPTNTKRVDIYIIGGVYGAGKVADSFFSAGTKNISVVAGVYQVSLIAVTPSGINGDPTNTFNITITNLVTEDTVAPDPISAGVVSGGVHPQDSSGRLGYLNVAVTNSTIPTDFAGYIVKIVGGTNTWTQTFNSTTALSNLYITGGLFVGQAYTLSVATTDGKNVSNYINCTPAPFTIADTRSNTSTVTGNLSFSATDSILTVSWVGSTDPYVDSYRVQVTSNTDTSFTNVLQTVESKGTTATFGGLTSNTTYRVRVTARYSGAAGALSTTHTTGTFTLNSSGAISDGVAPTSNPALTSNMVKSLFGAFAITFPEVDNSDAVTYEVFIKPTSATGIIDVPLTYKVLEVGGTFAVVKTLADKTTALTYGEDYYIAIRAKDNDGVSTGTVTAVGPIKTLQVTNADLAADSVYANNIFGGTITANKLTSDTVLANQKITVGDNAALDRIRLDATNATIATKAVSSRIYIGGGNYYDTASPFYADNLGRLSIGQSLKFEDGALTINGSGTFTGTVTAGAGLNSVKLGNDVDPTGIKDGIYIGATGDYIYTDGTLRLGNGGITYASGVLTVTGNIEASSIKATASLSGLSISGTTGTFGGALDVGTTTLASITNAYSVTESSVTRVRFVANNTLRVGDVVTISGIAQNQIFAYWAGPGNTNPVYNYSNNEYNLGTVNVYARTATTFDIQSSVNVSYTSGGSAFGSAFKVTSTGIVRAAAGQIGGWDINATQIRSNGTNYISLNPITPGIEIVSPSQGTITINPSEGIVGPNVTIAGNTGPGFSFSPNGNATLRGTIYANQGIFSGSVSGANITMTGTINGYGTASTKLLFQDSNYAISAGSSSFEYPNTDGYYDVDGEWVSSGGTTVVTNNDIRFTDATKAGAVPQPTETFSYGELWLGSGTNQKGTIDLFANYPGDYIGISILADTTTQNIIIKGPTSAGFETVHRSSASLSSTSESPAFLQVDSSGRLTRGRAIFSGGSSAPSSNIGLQGDLYFSTAV
jgi:hypothetical protein